MLTAPKSEKNKLLINICVYNFSLSFPLLSIIYMIFTSHFLCTAIWASIPDPHHYWHSKAITVCPACLCYGIFPTPLALSQSKPVISCIGPCLTVFTSLLTGLKHGSLQCMCMYICWCLPACVGLWTGNVVYNLYRQLLSKIAPELPSDWFEKLYISNNSMHADTNRQASGRLYSQLIMNKLIILYNVQFNFLVGSCICGAWWIQEYECNFTDLKPLFQYYSACGLVLYQSFKNECS